MFGRSKEEYEENGNKVTLITKSSGKKIKKTVSPDGNFKQRQVIRKYDDVNDTGGTVKKTVTRTPGGVEKEIERGNKYIEVDKYKNEGVKSRTVTNMKKNNQYKDDLKSSPFKNMHKAMFDNANSSKNTQVDGKISESKPLTTPQKKLINIPSEILKGTLDDMSTDGGFKTTKTTGKAIPQLKSKLTIIKKNKWD